MKFTTFIDESLGKNKSISSIYGGYKFLLYIKRKRLLEQKYISIFVIIHLSLSSSIPKEVISFNLAFSVHYIM